MDGKQYYINLIIDCATKNGLYEYTIDKLNQLSEVELIATWDALRWSYGDLSKKQ
jgi:hypothetical protein